jgi:signal transduction histidine kinase
MKTLIAEDNADDRRILRYNLERHGCTVIEAADGQEGLELARAHKPELIISDALMPRMDGYQFLRSVKTDDNLKSVPFIFYSAVYTGQKEAEFAVSIGADAFIVKPKEPEELWAAVLGILEQCKLKTRPAASAPLVEADEEYLRKYSAIVATKLEEKMIVCERAVTELKRAEEKLELKTAELERSNAELEHFAHVASHDLKEPLVSIGGFSELLLNKYKDRLDAKGREYLSRIMNGTARMEALINDLLAYSRVTTKARPFQPVDCNAVLRAALADLKAAIEESRAVITFDELPTVTGDETQLTQLFQNLISNAIKYRSERPLRVHVSAKLIDDPAAHSILETGRLFSVSDTGIGIDQAHFEKIFEIFQRLHADEKKYPGTGIGLAICKKIVERHGGRIWVESKPGEGSVFYFTLP